MKRKNRQRRKKEKLRRAKKQRIIRKKEKIITGLEREFARAKPGPEKKPSPYEASERSARLSMAIRANNYHYLKTLLGKDSSCIDAWNFSGVPPIVTAVRALSLDHLSLLLEHGADIDRQDGKGRTALIAAVIHARISMVDFLVREGADILIKDSFGKIARDYAKEMENGRKEALDAALFLPRTPADRLYKAIVSGDVEQVRYWLEARKVDPNEKAGPDREPLAVIASGCHGYESRAIMGLLLRHCGNPFAESRESRAAFMLAN